MRLSKSILKQYIDACELLKETEQDIEKLRRMETIEKKHDDAWIKDEKKILDERKVNAEKVRNQVEKYVNEIPVRMQRIIRFKFFEGLSWEQVADRIGRNATGDSLRKEFERFLMEE